LRAAANRLVAAAVDERRRIERELHDGPLQRLAALGVNLQLARRLLDGDPGTAKELLEDLSRDLQSALEETRELAERIYPPLLETGGLAVALRSAAVSADVPIHLDVEPGTAAPPAVAAAAYFCCVEALEHVSGKEATITVRAEGGLVFEVVDMGDGSSEAVMPSALVRDARDRVEALGGRLEITTGPGGARRVSGSIPLPRES
jgi:signal transduction histidine kinase